jgi:hypothetical protein
LRFLVAREACLERVGCGKQHQPDRDDDGEHARFAERESCQYDRDDECEHGRTAHRTDHYQRGEKTGSPDRGGLAETRQGKYRGTGEVRPDLARAEPDQADGRPGYFQDVVPEIESEREKEGYGGNVDIQKDPVITNERVNAAIVFNQKCSDDEGNPPYMMITLSRNASKP